MYTYLDRLQLNISYTLPEFVRLLRAEADPATQFQMFSEFLPR
jgi:hypothetical protein